MMDAETKERLEELERRVVALELLTTRPTLIVGPAMPAACAGGCDCDTPHCCRDSE